MQRHAMHQTSGLPGYSHRCLQVPQRLRAQEQALGRVRWWHVRPRRDQPHGEATTLPSGLRSQVRRGRSDHALFTFHASAFTQRKGDTCRCYQLCQGSRASTCHDASNTTGRGAPSEVSCSCAPLWCTEPSQKILLYVPQCFECPISPSSRLSFFLIQHIG